MKKLFITGTDTDVGKTFVSKLLLDEFNRLGSSTLGFKPISAGCEQSADGLRNEDALILQAASSVSPLYQHVNPIAFLPPIAPHIAAIEANVEISLIDLQRHYEKAQEYQSDYLLVEGAGGWRLPLNDKGQYLSDFVIQNQMPVVLVVGMRLGCLNHALLTLQAIEHDQLECVGWIANQLSPNMPYYAQNLHTLQSLIATPMLAEVPYATDHQAAELKKTSAFSELFN